MLGICLALTLNRQSGYLMYSTNTQLPASFNQTHIQSTQSDTQEIVRIEYQKFPEPKTAVEHRSSGLTVMRCTTGLTHSYCKTHIPNKCKWTHPFPVAHESVPLVNHDAQRYKVVVSSSDPSYQSCTGFVFVTGMNTTNFAFFVFVAILTQPSSCHCVILGYALGSRIHAMGKLFGWLQNLSSGHSK